MFTPWLLRVLALLLIGGGGWALVTGRDYIVLDSGVAMVVAGTVALVGGVVTLGIAGALARLEAIRRLLAAPMAAPAEGKAATRDPAAPALAAREKADDGAARGGPEADRPVAAVPAPRPGGAAGDGQDMARGASGTAAPALPTAEARTGDNPGSPERRVVRTFTSGAGTYTMYDDGRIEAVLPEGRLDFASIEELRRHLDQRALSSGT